MKKYLITAIALCCSVFGFSQREAPIKRLEDSGIRLSEATALMRAKATQGTPYVNKSFSNAKVGNIVANAMMRYNAANDSFEFINSTNDTLVLSKSASYNNITFTLPKADYYLVNYVEKNGLGNMGYLIKLYDKNEILLYKRQQIKYYEARPAKTSYETATPARYGPVENSFFLKTKESEITELPSNRKGFLKLYPERKGELETFIKQNDIDFEKEQDMIKLVDFLAK